MWLVFQRIHIGSFALLLPLSEVILSGGPWRSNIIPHPQPSVNTFLHFFFLVFSIFRKWSASGQGLRHRLNAAFLIYIISAENPRQSI